MNHLYDILEIVFYLCVAWSVGALAYFFIELFLPRKN